MKMLKMIIADDEYNVREGLKEVVRWEALGIEIIADAADGQEAFELCQELKPDILLTDIRMPMMDGLETALKLKELGDPVRIIIISGAQDFNYAKTALSLHADGYILKPIKINELEDTVRKVVSSISMERNREEKSQQLQQQLHENMPVLREKFLANLTQGMYKSEQDARNKIDFFGIPLEINSLFVVAVIQIDEYDKAIERYTEEHKQLLNFSVINILEEIAERNGAGIAFYMNENEYVILFNQAAQRDNRHLAICQEMIDCINTFLKISISVGVGNPVQKVYDLHSSYQEAQLAIEYKFYTGKDSILQISDFQTNKNNIEYPKLYEIETKLINFMKLGNKVEVTSMVEDIFQTLCANHNLPVDYVQSICIELIHMASRTLYEFGENIQLIIPDYSDLFSGVYEKREASELRDTMLSLFDQLTHYFAQKQTNKNSRTIQKIKDIIAQSYMENLTVARLSEEVYLSPNYISLIFKQETGESVTEYVTKVRMEAAKELLKDPDLKILDVSDMVGYENSTYFSTVFKKYTGVHPQKYRSLHYIS
jgi:two-component system response regulator YesN